jgi:hypothetical protein
MQALDRKNDGRSRLLLFLLFVMPLAVAAGRLPFLQTSPFLVDHCSLAHLPDKFRGAIENVLLVPLGALVVVIFRLTLGVQMLGLFRPILLAIAFNIIGVPISTGFLVAALTVIVLLRPALNADHNYARIAIMLSIAAALLLIPLILGRWLDVEWLMKIADFPIIALCLTCESFAKVLDGHGIREAIWRTLTTAAAAVVIMGLTTMSGVLDLFLRFPELLMAQAGCIMLISRYLNIRLFEGAQPLAPNPSQPLAAASEHTFGAESQSLTH